MAESAEKVLRHPSQDRILDEAESLFANRGFAGMSLSDLAEKAGLSKSSLFHHFPSKIEIYASVLERLFERLWIQLEQGVDSKAGAIDQLDAMVDVLVEFLAKNRNTAKLLLRALVERDFEDAGMTRDDMLARHGQYLLQVVQLLRSVVRQGIDSGVFVKRSAGHTVQTIVGAMLFHFASGEFGKEMIGGDMFSAEQVEARKREVRGILREGLLKK